MQSKSTQNNLNFVIFFVFLTACSHHYEGPRAYVSNEKDGTITVIDIRTDRAISSINVGARPRGIEPGPDGKSIWVALSYPTNSANGEDKIAVIDIASGKVITKYDAGTDPEIG